VCVVVGMELLLLVSYCRCTSMHAWAVVGAEMVLLSNYWCGHRHACVVVGVELMLSWS
jgi:hypothetical protein